MISEGLGHWLVLPLEGGETEFGAGGGMGLLVTEASTPSVLCAGGGSLAAGAEDILGRWEKWRQPPPLLTTLKNQKRTEGAKEELA